METERTFKRDLPVRLTEDELQRYGKHLAQKYQEEEAVDAQRKQVAKEYGTKISAIRNELSRLAEARSKGQELRPVECFERWANGVIEIVRRDTQEVVESRAETMADQQQAIPGLDDGVPARVLQFVPPDLTTPGQPEERTDAPGWYSGVDRIETEAAPSAGEADADGVGDVVDSSIGDEVFVGGGVEGEDPEAMAVRSGDDEDPPLFTPEPDVEMSDEDREIEEAHARRVAKAKELKDADAAAAKAEEDKAKGKPAKVGKPKKGK